ncbi:MAG: bifunctional proline dehydrogenase/L-glutamate gamma-semialdehyde dehydrogenase PutA [Rhodospirillales bacterium]
METLEQIRERLRGATLADEATCVARLLEETALSPAERQTISERAAGLVRSVRSSGKVGVMESFLAEYGLSTKEGVALMCLAEALLRVPDGETVSALIRDKITPHDWGAHLGDSGSILVNASTWALMLSGKMMDESDGSVAGALHSLTRRLGEPVLRKAVAQAMREMGAQFVLGRDMEEALRRGRPQVAKGFSYSYDMLGEAARTDADAQRYHRAYAEAIAAIAKAAEADDLRDNPGISVKLSALHPRYERGQEAAMLPVLTERLGDLARAAAAARIGFNIDAEEADRLDLSLDVIARTLRDPALAGWEGFGVVVQAYGRRAGHALDWLHALAVSLDRRIMVRLVKGAYWDSEIKRAQVLGLADYPVFTRKAHSDVSYIACARKLLGMTDRIYPQFATHNAHSVAAVLEMAGNDRDGFEFQRLHGMGEALHDAVLAEAGTRCRIYAPVGAHRDLLAYLVRRLLENGANSSFVNQIVDAGVSPETIAADPLAQVRSWLGQPNPRIAKPARIFGARDNAAGWDLTDPLDLARIESGRRPFAAPHRWSAQPVTVSPLGAGESRAVMNPADRDERVGTVREAAAAEAEAAVGDAQAAFENWSGRSAEARRACLLAAAALYEETTEEFLALACREAGKTLADGVAEVREAVDFLRYYADQALLLPANTAARGVIVCISPWNFPLAIFTGQIAAALAAGNAVVAKPAEQTPLIATRAVALLHEAGIPAGALQLLPGDGVAVGAPLTADPRIAGVCFTGSTEVAKLIDRQLAESAPDAMLIAETGGLNAMIVDSTALMEQAVRDIVNSAFRSAGQRCSALRVLYVQEEVEARLLEMLFGAMDCLTLGDPWQLSSDVGPVIDEEARQGILAYLEEMTAKGALLKQLPPADRGLFVPPSVLRVSGIEAIEREVFGPVLHVARFKSGDLDQVVAAINAKGYGLTFGLHTRIDRRVQDLVDRLQVGNLYVNRDQIGAVVGSQPFGGEGLSGTGPKAGGPLYLRRFRKALQAAAEVVPVPGAQEIDLAALERAREALDWQAWAKAQDRIGRLRAALRGKAATAIAAAAGIDSGPVDLPGPTGEANQLFLPPRGLVLCLGPDGDSLLAQTVQALALGNGVIAAAPGARSALAALSGSGAPLAVLEGQLSGEALAEVDVDAVAYAGGGAAAAEIRRICARRAGPILTLITGVLAPAAYCAERSLCIDTTAAGGNASLLAAAE